MLELEDIPLFAAASAAGFERLLAAARVRKLSAGARVVRRGDVGRDVYAVASGGVHAQLSGDRRRSMGPGQIFGEMSLISGRPISVTVIAARDSVLWTVDKRTFLEVLEAESGMRARLVELLVDRLREDGTRSARAQIVVLCTPRDDVELADSWGAAVTRAVRRYEPRVRSIDAHGAGTHPSPGAWKRDADDDELLLVTADAARLAPLADELAAGDAIVHLGPASQQILDSTETIGQLGLVDHARVRRPEDRPAERALWSHVLDRGELRALASPTLPPRESVPHTDSLARWITRRQVGLALGAGAARGLAHLGVLEVLEREGVPIDRLVGASMGGIAALLYGLGGSASEAIRLATEALGRRLPNRIRWLPRSSFISDRELRRRVRAISRGQSLGDLTVPVAVVAADLVRGERVAIQRGPVEEALLATAAMPGALPPVDAGDRVLVDGAMVSRIPIDLLDRERCGLTIAVNVVPSPEERRDVGRDAERLRSEIGRVLGFRQVIARSWELLGWSQGATDASSADVLIEPRTSSYSGYNFSTLEDMVEAGRTAAAEKIGEIRGVLGSMLTGTTEEDHP